MIISLLSLSLFSITQIGLDLMTNMTDGHYLEHKSQCGVIIIYLDSGAYFKGDVMVILALT